MVIRHGADPQEDDDYNHCQIPTKNATSDDRDTPDDFYGLADTEQRAVEPTMGR